MKKIYLISAAGLVAAGLLVILFIYLKKDAGTSPDVDSAGANTQPTREKEVEGLKGDSTAQQSSDWASKPAAEIDRNFHDTKNRAEAGDPVAQRQLAEMYERCSIYSLSPENFASTLDSFSKLKKENSSRYDQIKKRVAHYCNEIDGGKVIPSTAYNLWYEEAAKRGDLIAQLKVASGKALSPEAYEDLVAKALESKDAEAIFAVEEMLSNSKGPTELGSYAPEVGGNYSEFAWALAGCRAGADCGPGSYRMDSMCINYGVCNTSNYEDLIRKNFVSSGQLKVIDKEVERIQSMFKTNN